MSRFFKQFTVLHVVKHVVLTTGLTLVGGPGGLAIGVIYCVGDTVGECKKFKAGDFEQFLSSLPSDVRDVVVEKYVK